MPAADRSAVEAGHGLLEHLLDEVLHRAGERRQRVEDRVEQGAQRAGRARGRRGLVEDEAVLAELGGEAEEPHAGGRRAARRGPGGAVVGGHEVGDEGVDGDHAAEEVHAAEHDAGAADGLARPRSTSGRRGDAADLDRRVGVDAGEGAQRLHAEVRGRADWVADGLGLRARERPGGEEGLRLHRVVGDQRRVDVGAGLGDQRAQVDDQAAGIGDARPARSPSGPSRTGPATRGR